MKLQCQSSGLPLIPAGEYIATFVGLEIKKVNVGGKTMELAHLNFRIHIDGKEVILNYTCSNKFTPYTKLGKGLALLAGKSQFMPDEEVDLDLLLNKKAKVKVAIKQGQRGLPNFSIIEEIVELV